ncbi:hypothetical protein LV78_005478 [Actinosynnema pretiosum]|nr:hypothetical protein [Actinosynnema pretiosum]
MSVQLIVDGFAPITMPMTGEQYIEVLVERQRAWEQKHTKPGMKPGFPALLEWFILPGEELLVQLPEPAPATRPVRRPRRYRSAESLRQERDQLVQRMAAIAGTDDTPDRAAANLSPRSSSRAARSAGRRRFDRMDRALETYTRLSQRLTVLNGRIARAEAREKANR